MAALRGHWGFLVLDIFHKELIYLLWLNRSWSFIPKIIITWATFIESMIFTHLKIMLGSSFFVGWNGIMTLFEFFYVRIRFGVDTRISWKFYIIAYLLSSSGFSSELGTCPLTLRLAHPFWSPCSRSLLYLLSWIDSQIIWANSLSKGSSFDFSRKLYSYKLASIELVSYLMDCVDGSIFGCSRWSVSTKALSCEEVVVLSLLIIINSA
jgi:hypothetical protein